MFDSKRTVGAIVAGFAPDEDDPGAKDFESIDVTDNEIMAAEDVADALRDSYMPQTNENDSAVERASKEASRRAKAEILAKTLKAFWLICDSGPSRDE